LPDPIANAVGIVAITSAAAINPMRRLICGLLHDFSGTVSIFRSLTSFSGPFRFARAKGPNPQQ